MNTLRIRTIGVALMLGSSAAMAQTPYVGETMMPSDGGPLYYILGGGLPVAKPASYYTPNQQGSNISVKFGYSCGNFDFAENLSAMLENFTDELTKVPQTMLYNVQAYAASLPSYLMNKANPGFYNITTKSLDEAFAKFNVSVKSCEEFEADIAAGGNPFSSLVQSAMGENWQTVAAEEPRADHAESKVKEEGPSKGIKLTEGERYGGEGQPPVRPNWLMAITGYNSMIARSPLDDLSTPGSAYHDTELVRMWASPEEAADWIIAVIGDHWMTFAEGGSNQSKSGIGLRPYLEEAMTDLQIALMAAVNENDFTELRQFKLLQVGPPLIESMRKGSEYERGIMIQRLSFEMGAARIKHQTALAKRIMLAGLMEANLSQSESANIIIEMVRGRSLPDLDYALQEIRTDLELREETLVVSAPTIMSYADAKRQGIAPGAMEPRRRGSNPFINGGISTE